jgi:signal transduction histidine kinase
MKMEKQRAIFEEQERTMSQLSKEVHDNLGGYLNLAMMNIHVIKEYQVDDEHDEATRNVGNILTQLISEVQNISHSMNSSYIKNRGLFDVLKGQLKYIDAARNIKCDIEISGEEDFLNADKQLLVYRIAQEAIQNAIKHSEASTLTINLMYSSTGFKMTVSDDGVGFSKEALSTGIGLMNMRERAHMLNGLLNIISASGAGCTIELKMNR